MNNSKYVTSSHVTIALSLIIYLMFMHLFNIHSGGWSTNKVTTMLINSSYIQCLASHLACFAVLSDVSGTSGRETAVRLQLFCVKHVNRHLMHAYR